MNPDAGSALRVRGNPSGTPRFRRPARFRSACAGQPSQCHGLILLVRVPLCVCGATCGCFLELQSGGGSALRVRGNRSLAINAASSAGFRSACAGQPLAVGLPEQPAEVPLCVCGATITITPNQQAAAGSALRVRGNPARQPEYHAQPGFRSACAGQPVTLFAGRHRCSVPLCVCGATPGEDCQAEYNAGSALRVRGNRTTAAASWCRSGFRSACAGQPLDM